MKQLRIPAVYMRGGTSKGVFFLKDDLPADSAQRERLAGEFSERQHSRHMGKNCSKNRPSRVRKPDEALASHASHETNGASRRRDCQSTRRTAALRRVGVWRGVCRSSISVSRPFRLAVP